MARLVKQFRYYGDVSAKNYPDEANYATLAAGNIFNSYRPVTQMGIQGTPGIKFYINNSLNPIIMGDTGIYEVDLQGLGTIDSIRFDRDSLALMDEYNPLLVDIIYEGG